MERLKLRLQNVRMALGTLQEILRESFSKIVRDATIQRFEYTFEAFWKFVREYLKEREGVLTNSPKACFREIFSLGFCSEDESVRLLEMTDRRNETVHTYQEAVAQKIYAQIKGDAVLIESLLSSFAEKL